MIFLFKNKEYCLTDWQISPNGGSHVRRLVEHKSKNDLIGFNYDILSINTFDFFGTGILLDVALIYKKIYPNKIISISNLSKAKEDLDHFLQRVDKIKCLI